jgi:DNA-binding FrmR family transcriptional regulator
MSTHGTGEAPTEIHIRHGSAEVRGKVAARLRSIEGHVRGVTRMVEEGAYCIDLLKQTLAIQRALDKINALLLQDHLEHCVAAAISAPDPAERRRTIAELLEVFALSGRL